MPWDAGAIVSKLSLDRSKFSAAIKQVSGEVKGFGGLIQKNSTQIKKMGRQMTVAGGVIVGALGMMVKAYGSFDQAMTESLAIMGNVSAAMRDKMAKTAKQLSTETTFAAKDLAQAYFFLASAGMNAEQSISALAPVARFAQAGAFDLAQATDLLTDAQTALGLSSKDVIENEKNLIRVSDVLVGANTLANASVLQFSESLTNKAAAALVNLNKEVEEGVAVLAAYADKGVKGRLAGNRLTMMLNGLFAATQQNKKAWDAAGISLWEADGSMRSIADIIQDMEGYLGSMTVEQRTAELAVLGFNVKTKDSILTLMGSSEKIRGWTGDLKVMGGKTKEVADKQLEAFNAKMTILKNVVVGAAIEIGKSLAPMIEDLGAKIKAVTEEVTKWIEKHPELTEAIAKSAATIGVLMLVLGPLAMMLPGLVLGFKLLLPVVSALATPVTLLVAAIAGVAISVQEMVDNLNTAKKAMSDFGEEALVFKNAAENFQKLWITVRKEGGETLEQFDELMKRFGGNWDMILKTIIKDPKFANLKTLLFEVATGLKTISLEGKDLSIKLPAAFQKAGKGLVEPIRTNSEDVLKLISEMVDGIKKATLNEFAYRKWAAEKTYKERKAFLDKEKADDEAYAVAKKAYTAELNQIEEDRTQKFKEGWAERGRAVTAGLLKWRAEQKKYQSFIAEFTDIIKKHALSERNYKIEQLDVWYKAKAQTLEDIYGDSKQFYAAMELLDKAYAASLKAILAETLPAWAVTANKILAGAAEIVSGLDAIFGQFHANEAMRLDNEEKQQTDAIESWFERERTKIEATITNEEEKVAALEALDEEKARKENELQHKMDKERRKLERKRAKSQKVTAIFSATISMAEAIVKALTAGPLIGQIFAGIVAGLAGIQIAAISATPLPALQRGGRITEIGGIVGERGPELFVPERPGMIIPLRREAAPVGMTCMRIIIQNRIIVGEQTFYKESVKSINKAGELRELKIPNEVVV